MLGGRQSLILQLVVRSERKECSSATIDLTDFLSISYYSNSNYNLIITSINRKFMEGHDEETSSPVHRAEMSTVVKKLPKLNRINPSKIPAKKVEEEIMPSLCITPPIKAKSGKAYLGKQDGKVALGNVLHIRPVYSFGIALQRLEMLGDSSPFEVKKVRSFPSNKFELFEKSTAASYDLTSNFFGSKYQLTGETATYLTIRFQVGCGSSQFRSCRIYALREDTAWGDLQGLSRSHDLQELYSIGNNYQKIAKYASLQPTIHPNTGGYTLKFSRKFVIPCVENAIICNFNGQRLFQMAKINEMDSHFQILQWAKMETVKVLAIIVASLDFKLCTQ